MSKYLNATNASIALSKTFTLIARSGSKGRRGLAASQLGLGGLDGVDNLLRRVLSVALRVVLDPVPQVLASLLHGELRLPIQLLVGQRRVGGEVEDVAVSSGLDLVREVTADNRAEGVDDVEDGAATAGSQVPGLDTGVVLAEVVESDEVTTGQIQDVDVVSDGGTILGVVVCRRLEGLEERKLRVDSPSPKTSSCFMSPVATLPRRGSRL